MPFIAPPDSYSAQSKQYMRRLYNSIMQDVKTATSIPILSKLPVNPKQGTYYFKNAIAGHPIITKSGTYSFDGTNWTGRLDEQFWGNDRISDVSADKITAGTIDAEVVNVVNLRVASDAVPSGSNLIPYPSFEDGTAFGWTPFGQPASISVVAYNASGVPSNCPSPYCMQYNYTGASTFVNAFACSRPWTDGAPFTDGIDVSPGQQYNIKIAAARNSSFASGTFAVLAYFIARDGTISSSASINVAYNALSTVSFTELEGSFTVPTNIFKCQFVVETPTHTAGKVFFTNLRVWRKADASLVVDGLIQAGSAIIADAAIRNAQIASLEADKINTGTLNALNVNCINLNAVNLQYGSIPEARFGNNTIGSDPVKDGVLHKKQDSYSSVVNVAYNASLNVSNTPNTVVGPLSFSSNSNRTFILLLATMVPIDTSYNAGNQSIGFRRGSSTYIGPVGYMSTTTVSGIRIPVTAMYVDTGGGTGAIDYYIAMTQSLTSSPNTFPFRVNFTAIEFSK